MKKQFRVLAALLAVIVCMCTALTGCGSSAPKEDDAKKYVQAVLDLMCTGEYDKSVKFADVEEGKETEMRDELIDEMLSSVADDASMDEATKGKFRDFIMRAFENCKYTVKDAVKTNDDGSTGYDVTVSIEPLKVFDGAMESMQEEMTALTSDTEKLMNMSEEEMYGVIYDALFKILNANLDNPTYGEPQDIVVHYGLIDKEKKMYGTSSEDGEKLGQALFSMEGLE